MSATAVRERPILFSSPMVRAILDGRKTQTRRVVKPQSMFAGREAIVARFPNQKGGPFAVGLRLWVREKWQDYCPIWGGYWCGHGTQEGIEKEHRPVYAADPPELHLRSSDIQGHDYGEGHVSKMAGPIKWRPGIHMPRWACRLVLEVTAVRVERLQAISSTDAKAEGAFLGRCDCGEMQRRPASGMEAAFRQTWCHKHGEEVAHLWDSINGKTYPWASNPWVWVVTFKRLGAPCT